MNASDSDVVSTLSIGAPGAFHAMAKPTGAICNLDCEYCFFLSKEMLYPVTGSVWPTTYLRPISVSCSRRTEA